MAIGIIGGTGLYSLDWVGATEETRVETAFGEVVCFLANVGETKLVFLPRHGADHSTPPHKVNYRANICALKELAVTTVFASSASGSLSLELPPGRLALPDQFLDFTKLRATTFFDGAEGGAIHVDVTEPYCPRLRSLIGKAAARLGLEVSPSATYVCAEGPRFETPAEIRFFAQAGGHLVGMTGVPETVLAREAELCYASLAVVTNFAAGISESSLTHGEVVEVMNAQLAAISRLLQETLERPDLEADCPCRHALDEYRDRGVLPPRGVECA